VRRGGRVGEQGPNAANLPTAAASKDRPAAAAAGKLPGAQRRVLLKTGDVLEHEIVDSGWAGRDRAC
jgi:hypothetical protein